MGREMVRLMRTAKGMEYELTYKRVKNLNLRVGEDGSVRVSAARRVPLWQIDAFVQARAGWIEQARERVRLRAQQMYSSAAYTDEECLAVFCAVSDRIYPLFASVLPQKPEIRVRRMKSRWGVCNPARCRITLNTQLMDRPAAAVEYVVLHEYVHFLHPNHQKGFHDMMARLMPDYKMRRKLLSV
ncbi:DUF45 domain-containing protein [Anaerotruncus colihominis]|uniref:DUF45 domain-containing protein n=3 Tax=Anaerotruncus colihominis TaxID=169435 RepID=A0A845SRD8_9FIRM|nr:SprT-like domain-containing protein [Anaerotruncus sp.]MCI8492845.1 M48 family metallopeptidase [Anaerotruncus sp.]NBI79332.1 DUF45 domain-containing protein [Anaerotruncus colihominis]NDO39076.1 M48 family metallopeptidase [Anaerotruncus colihominis]